MTHPKPYSILLPFSCTIEYYRITLFFCIFVDLTVCLKQIAQCNLSKHLDVDTVEIIPSAETKNVEKRLAFSEVLPPSDFVSVFKPNLSVQAAKSILKTTTNSSNNTKRFTGKP